MNTQNLINETINYLYTQYSIYKEQSEQLTEFADNIPQRYIARLAAGGRISLENYSNTESRGVKTTLTNRPLKTIYQHLADPSHVLRRRALLTTFRDYNINKARVLLSASEITNQTEHYFFLDNLNADTWLLKLIKISLPTHTSQTRAVVHYYECPIDLTSLKHPVFVDFMLKTNRGGTRVGAGKPSKKII